MSRPDVASHYRQLVQLRAATDSQKAQEAQTLDAPSETNEKKRASFAKTGDA
jgi:hypothetical protein